MSWCQYERRRASTQARNWPRDVPEDTSVLPVGTNEINLEDESNPDTNQGSGELGEGKDSGLAKIQDYFRSFWPKTPAGLSEDDKLPAVGASIIGGDPNIDRTLPSFLGKDYDYVWSNKGSPYKLHVETKLNDQQRLLRNQK